MRGIFFLKAYFKRGEISISLKKKWGGGGNKIQNYLLNPEFNLFLNYSLKWFVPVLIVRLLARAQDFQETGTVL